jgi:uncharacterized membrane protein (DUF373 family)
VLFAIGVFDVALQMAQLLLSGKFTNVSNILGVIDTVLLLMIVLAVFRDLESYIRGRNLLYVIVQVGIIAVVRNIIITIASNPSSNIDTIYFSASSLLLLTGLFIGYYIIEKYGEVSNTDRE